jgi:hypothetical protein
MTYFVEQRCSVSEPWLILAEHDDFISAEENLEETAEETRAAQYVAIHNNANKSVAYRCLRLRQDDKLRRMVGVVEGVRASLSLYGQIVGDVTSSLEQPAPEAVNIACLDCEKLWGVDEIFSITLLSGDEVLSRFMPLCFACCDKRMDAYAAAFAGDQRGQQSVIRPLTALEQAACLA